MLTDDPIIWRRDLQAATQRSSETIRRWLKTGALPPPDFHPSPQVMGWRLSTLTGRGLHIDPASPPTPAASADVAA
jgi:hypothetical protein